MIPRSLLLARDTIVPVAIAARARKGVVTRERFARGCRRSDRPMRRSASAATSSDVERPAVEVRRRRRRARRRGRRYRLRGRARGRRRHRAPLPAGLAGSPWAIAWPARKFCAIIVPSTVPAMLPSRLLAMIPPKPGPAAGTRPNSPSNVPGSRTSARVATRASACGLSRGVRPFGFGHLGPELFEQHPSLLRREPRERLDVRLLDGFRRRRLQHVAVSRERLLVLGRPRLAGPRRCVPGTRRRGGSDRRCPWCRLLL